MHHPTRSITSRRDFLKHTGRVAAAGALLGTAVPHVHASEDNTIRLAVIGCGGRGSGAVGNAVSASGGPVKLVAMADLFTDHLAASHANLSREFGKKIDVPPEHRFLGLRRLSPRYRLPAAGRRGDPHDPFGLPRHAPGIRRAEGRQRVPGKIVFARSRRHPPRHQGRRGGGEEEPENRRRADVPALVRPAGLDREGPRGRAGPHRADPRLPDGRQLHARPLPGRRERAALADPPRRTISSGSPRACLSR